MNHLCISTIQSLKLTVKQFSFSNDVFIIILQAQLNPKKMQLKVGPEERCRIKKAPQKRSFKKMSG